MKGINTPNDLEQIMLIGNELYSNLTQLVRQSFLRLTELPTMRMLTVFEENYQLDYSTSYTGNVHGDSNINGYGYCMGLQTAFESLISQHYKSFILIVGCIGVAIIHHPQSPHFH